MTLLGRLQEPRHGAHVVLLDPEAPVVELGEGELSVRVSTAREPLPSLERGDVVVGLKGLEAVPEVREGRCDRRRQQHRRKNRRFERATRPPHGRKG